jgi:ribosome-associated heat shock protein Hsp15
LPPDRQRIDKWLWHARVARTRTATAALAASGHVRVNGTRIDAASRAVKTGDVITVALDSRVRVLKVLGFAERRGAAEAAAKLFEEQPLEPFTAHQPAALSPAVRPDKPGRPTKRDRRTMLRFTGDREP